MKSPNIGEIRSKLVAIEDELIALDSSLNEKDPNRSLILSAKQNVAHARLTLGAVGDARVDSRHA